MKLVLNCKYGTGVPGDTVDVKEKVAKSMIASGAARLPKDGENLTADEAKKELTVKKGEVTKLTNINKDLATKIEALEATALEDAEAIKALEAKVLELTPKG